MKELSERTETLQRQGRWIRGQMTFEPWWGLDRVSQWYVIIFVEDCLFFLSKSYFLLMMYWNVHLFWFSPCCQLSLCSDRLVEVFYHIDLLQQSHFSVASFHQNTSAKREYYEEEHVAIFHIIDTGCWICTEVWLVML